MTFVSRGFKRREGPAAPEDRVPPGQYVTRDFPVLSAGPTPRIGLDEWRFEVIGPGRPTARLELGRSSPPCRPRT